MRLTFLFFILIVMLSSCMEDTITLMAETNEEYSGGENGTTFDFSENAFGEPMNGLTSDEENLFVVGNSLFRRNWVTAPSSVESLDGLGPLFNAISCGSCHFKDGRAKPPETPEDQLNGLLIRLSVPGSSVHGNPMEEPIYGAQLQDKSIINVDEEARVSVSYLQQGGTYQDGHTYSLRQPVYTFSDFKYGDPTSDLLYSPRIAPQLPGLGLLENIPEEDILALADEQDKDNDGISGRPNYVWDAEKQQMVLGRFGWKANEPNVKQQVAGAFNGDMGITSPIFQEDHLTEKQKEILGNVPNGGTPELTDRQLARVTLYIQGLAVPARRDHELSEVLEGKLLFEEINCSGCHTPKFTTAANSYIDALNNQVIRPYTDLLLHDMGPGLADNRPDFQASGQEWRTPPLWGIGMVKVVNNHTFFLHDGRARTLEEAILWHGGEAEASKNAFMQLSKSERSAIIRFMESL